MRKTILFAIMFAVMISSVALAQSNSVSTVTTTSSVSTATTGTNVVVTTTATASGGDVSNVQLQLVKVSGNGSGSCTGSSDFSVSDPGSPYTYTTTVSTSGTTKSFTFTVGNCGTYTYHVTATWSGGSKSSSDATIEYVDPESVTVTPSPSTAQLNLTQSFTLNIEVQNSNDADIGTSYALNLPTSGGTSLITRTSGDDLTSSGTTISAQSTQTFSWTLKHNSCFTGDKSITFDFGDTTSAATVTVTGNSTCGSSSSSSSSTSSSSSGGASTSSQVTATVVKLAVPNSIKATLSTLAKDKEAVITPPSDVDVGLTKILFTAAKALVSVEVTVRKLDSKPAAVTQSIDTGTVYRYIEISHNVAEPEISAATIQFDVDKSWLDANGIDPVKVSLYRYTEGKWNKLVTSKTGETSDKVSYSAGTPGFSVFAINGEQKTADGTTASNQTGAEATTGEGTGQQQETTPFKISDESLLWAVAGLIIIAVLAVIFVLVRKRPRAPKKSQGYSYTPRKK